MPRVNVLREKIRKRTDGFYINESRLFWGSPNIDINKKYEYTVRDCKLAKLWIKPINDIEKQRRKLWI